MKVFFQPEMGASLKMVLLVSLILQLQLYTPVLGYKTFLKGIKNPGRLGPQSPFSPPRKESFHAIQGIASAASRAAPEAGVKASDQEKAEVVSASAYQNQIIATKPRPEKAGSQEAPADATSGLLTHHSSGKPKKNIFCYYGSSANSRPDVGKFWPEHIDPFLCTHLIFAFVDITEDGTGIKPNNWNDLGDNGLYARTMNLKKKNPDLKILLAVGGWKIGSKPFLPIMKSEEVWDKWVSNVISYLRKFNFDGLDMDWEFPAWRGSGPEDKHKFTLLMKDLYEGFAEESKSSGKDRLILTLATASSAFYAETSYEQSEIHKYIDFMLLMTYNYHGSGWEKHTGHHSALLPHPLDPEGEQRELYALWSVKYWLNFGVPKEKMILGLATYGLGWKLTDKSQTGVRAPADGGNTKGKYTEESGILSHYEICEKVIEENWKVKWIEEQKVPYAYGGGEWVGFDSPDSFYLKAATIIKEGLGGAFVWSVEMDDFNGHCGGPKYPLLRTIYDAFTQSSQLAGLRSDSSLKWDPSLKSDSSLKWDPSLKSDSSLKWDPSLKSDSSLKWDPSVKSDSSLKWDPSLKSAPASGHRHIPAAKAVDHGSSAAAVEGPLVAHNHDHHDQETSKSSSESGEDAASDDAKETESSSNGSQKETESASDDSNDVVDSKSDTDNPIYNSYDDDQDTFSQSSVDCNKLGLGIHADPSSCHHFVLCLPLTTSIMAPTRMTCPAGTLFDEKLQVCNHEHNVVCQH